MVGSLAKMAVKISSYQSGRSIASYTLAANAYVINITTHQSTVEDEIRFEKIMD